MWGFGGGASSRRRQGGLGTEPPAFGDFYNFLIKNNTFLCIFRLKFLFKNIFLISSIINKTVNDLELNIFLVTKIHNEKSLIAEHCKLF